MLRLEPLSLAKLTCQFQRLLRSHYLNPLLRFHLNWIRSIDKEMRPLVQNRVNAVRRLLPITLVHLDLVPADMTAKMGLM